MEGREALGIALVPWKANSLAVNDQAVRVIVGYLMSDLPSSRRKNETIAPGIP